MAKSSKTFVPPQLKDVDKLQTGGVILSRLYFSIANELREKLHKNSKIHGNEFDNNVIPIIILYCTCVESYFNEQLSILAFKTSDEETLGHIESVRYSTGDFRHSNRRFSEIYRLFDPMKNGIDVTGSIYVDLLALTALRNSLVHYTPRIIDHVMWPQSLEQVLHRTKIEVINSDWVSNFMRISVADWSHSVSKNAIREFSRISGQIDPFNSAQYPYPFCWE